MSTLNGGPGNIVTNGLVMYLDAANYLSYTSGSTSWYDLTGNNTAGSLINGPTYTPANVGAIVFDGSNDYVTIPHSPAQSFTGDFTIEAVIYATANSGNCIIQKGSGNDYFQEYWLLQDMRPGGSYGYVNFIMGKTGNTSANYIKTADNLCVLNTYYHIVATVQGTIGTVYLNSEPKASSSISNRIQSTSNIMIGRRVDNQFQAAGRIPFVKLYNRALSASEVLQNYNAQKTRFGL